MRQTVLADQLSDAVKGVLVLGGVVVVPLLLVGIGVLGWHLERKRARRYEADTRPGALRHNCFDGRYCVDVSPVQWQLDIATVRTIAAERGYVETRPRFAGAMSFVLSGEAGRRMPPGPARYEPEFAGAAALSSRERSEEHTSELQSRFDLVCRLLLEKKKNTKEHTVITHAQRRTYE